MCLLVKLIVEHKFPTFTVYLSYFQALLCFFYIYFQHVRVQCIYHILNIYSVIIIFPTYTGGVISLARVKSIARRRFDDSTAAAVAFFGNFFLQNQNMTSYPQHIKISGPCDYSKCL